MSTSQTDLAIDRRRFLQYAGAAALLPACGDASSEVETVGEANEQELGVRTPTCVEPTESNPLGPYYKSGAPYRNSVVQANSEGIPLRVLGYVRSVGESGAVCKPIAGAVLDFWQADENGEYDTVGYRMRARLTSSDQGIYYFDTVVPGRYLDGDEYRPSHIHVKVSAKGVDTLVTQLYFPNDPYNSIDPMYDRRLVVTPVQSISRKTVRFDFILG